MKRYTLLSAAFILFGFTNPAESNSSLLTRTGASYMAGPSISNSPFANLGEVPVTAESELIVEKAFDDYIEDSFDEMDLRGKGLKLEVFKKAVIGFQNLKRNHKISNYKSIISIVDFTKSSRQKRLWIVDLKGKKLLYHSLVAHGEGSGGDMATTFSNKLNSHQSSLGFYVTGNTYTGKHGLSLKLHGMDKGFNTNALARAVVVHGADYVSTDFIKRHGRLGRSYGCPAIPSALNNRIINLIKDRTVLYIEGGVNSYSSVYLNKSNALAQFASENKIYPSTQQASI